MNISLDVDNYKLDHYVTGEHSWLTLDSSYVKDAESIYVALFFDTVYGVRKMILALKELETSMLAKQLVEQLSE